MTTPKWFAVGQASRLTFRSDGTVTSETVATGGAAVRKYRQRQMWRRHLAVRIYRLSHAVSRLADRLDPWESSR